MILYSILFWHCYIATKIKRAKTVKPSVYNNDVLPLDFVFGSGSLIEPGFNPHSWSRVRPHFKVKPRWRNEQKVFEPTSNRDSCGSFTVSPLTMYQNSSQQSAALKGSCTHRKGLDWTSALPQTYKCDKHLRLVTAEFLIHEKKSLTN